MEAYAPDDQNDGDAQEDMYVGQGHGDMHVGQGIPVVVPARGGFLYDTSADHGQMQQQHMQGSYEAHQPAQRGRKPGSSKAAREAREAAAAGATQLEESRGGAQGDGGEGEPIVEFKHAVEYVAKVKQRFKDRPKIYGGFLDILHDYQCNRTIDEVYERVQKLFHDQPDLLQQVFPAFSFLCSRFSLFSLLSFFLFAFCLFRISFFFPLFSVSVRPSIPFWTVSLFFCFSSLASAPFVNL